MALTLIALNLRRDVGRCVVLIKERITAGYMKISDMMMIRLTTRINPSSDRSFHHYTARPRISSLNGDNEYQANLSHSNSTYSTTIVNIMTRHYSMYRFHTNSSSRRLSPRGSHCQTPCRSAHSTLSRFTRRAGAPARQVAASQLLSVQPIRKSSPHHTRRSRPTRTLIKTEVMFVYPSKSIGVNWQPPSENVEQAGTRLVSDQAIDSSLEEVALYR